MEKKMKNPVKIFIAFNRFICLPESNICSKKSFADGRLDCILNRYFIVQRYTLSAFYMYIFWFFIKHFCWGAGRVRGIIIKSIINKK
jgi:hypothetical protein